MSSASDTPCVYIGAYGFCRDPSGRLLLVRMASGLDQGKWTMPGGGIEWGEHPEAALLRELEEETGIAEVEAIGITEVYSHTYPRSVERPYDSVHHVGIIYKLPRPQIRAKRIDGSLRVVQRASSPVAATDCGGSIRS